MPLDTTLVASLLLLVLVQAGDGLLDHASMATPPQKAPIVFIPGKGGSQLEVKVDPDLRGPCPERVGWTRAWIDIYDFLPFTGNMACWEANLRLEYNRTRMRSEPAAGREFRVPGWGSTKSVEYIDPSWMAYVFGNVGLYAANMVHGLAARGYVSGNNLVAAPYDFRFAPWRQGEYMARLRRLVEAQWRAAGGRRVLLLAHSMGGLVATYFLRRQSGAWRRRHVQALVTLNTPWDGAMVSAQLHAAGDDWGMDIVDRRVIRNLQRTYESGYFLLPHGDTWGPEDAVIQTPGRNFSVGDYEELFALLGHPEGSEIVKRTRRAWDALGHPGVPLYCWYGHGIPTVDAVMYGQGTWPHGVPDVRLGDGDGTANLGSLRACSRFARVRGGTRGHVEVRGFQGQGHLDLMHTPEMIERLAELAAGSVRRP